MKYKKSKNLKFQTLIEKSLTERNMTKLELGEAMGLKRTAMWTRLNDPTLMTLEEMKKLAKILHIDIMEIVRCV